MSAIDIMADNSLHSFQLVILHTPHDIQLLFGSIFILKKLSPIYINPTVLHKHFNVLLQNAGNLNKSVVVKELETTIKHKLN